MTRPHDTKNPPKTRPRRLGVTLAMATALTAAACGHDDPPQTGGPTATTPAPSPASPSPGTPPGLPDPRTINHRDATAVSRAAVQVMWTIDATIDQHGQHEAYQRAVPYLTAEYTATITKAVPAGSIPATWAAHRAYTKVQLKPRKPEGDVPADTTTTAHRGWAITVTPTGRDGWTGTPVHAIAFVVLTRADPASVWKISHVGTA